MPGRIYPLEVALAVAEQAAGWLAPVCTRVQTVGSVRRQRATVHDVDLLCIPRNADAFNKRLIELVVHQEVHVAGSDDARVVRLVHRRTGMGIDVFKVPNISCWWTALVALTGSAEWLRRLRRRAGGNVCQLHADGSIEVLPGRFVWPRSERGFFRYLRCAFVRAEERN